MVLNGKYLLLKKTNTKPKRKPFLVKKGFLLYTGMIKANRLTVQAVRVYISLGIRNNKLKAG